MKKIVFLLAVIAFSAGAAFADVTLQVGDKIKLESGFGEAYAGKLKQVVYKYTIPSTYLALDPASLATAADVYETVEGDTLTGVFTAEVRDGVVAAPVFEAIAATPLNEEGVRESVGFTDVSVTATSTKDKAINVSIVSPENVVVEPEPEEPTLVWTFRVTRVGVDPSPAPEV